MFSARLQRTHTGWLRKSIITASYIGNTHKGQILFPHNVRHNKLSPKDSFLGRAHKNAAHRFPASFGLYFIFLSAGKYVSDNYFNTNNLVLT